MRRFLLKHIFELLRCGDFSRQQSSSYCDTTLFLEKKHAPTYCNASIFLENNHRASALRQFLVKLFELLRCNKLYVLENHPGATALRRFLFKHVFELLRYGDFSRQQSSTYCDTRMFLEKNHRATPLRRFFGKSLRATALRRLFFLEKMCPWYPPSYAPTLVFYHARVLVSFSLF